jgi:hypothetical protein
VLLSLGEVLNEFKRDSVRTAETWEAIVFILLRGIVMGNYALR